MKTLILQHTRTTDAGTTLDWLQQKNLPFEVLFVPEIQQWPAIDSFDHLVVCGGGMNVDQEDIYTWLKNEKKFILQSIQAHKKTLGLCLGAQLISEVLGGKVQKHSHWEAGWFPVQLTSGKTMIAFEWHGYTFSLPEGAKLTATNEQCREQGFQFQNHVLGFQFHPEATAPWITERAHDDRKNKQGFIQKPEEILQGIPTFQKLQQNWYFEQLDALFQQGPVKTFGENP